MFTKNHILTLLITFFSLTLFAQKDSTAIKDLRVKGKVKFQKYSIQNPLAPSKAAFYSAIFPGMGQIYNKKHWKAPIVWGALAGTTAAYLFYNDEYKIYRTAFKLREAGFKDEFTLDDGTELLSRTTLISAQKQLRESKDFWLLSTVIVYILQIVEASVNAHLMQFNTDDNLSLEPLLTPNPMRIDAPRVGLTIKYSF